MSRLWFEIRYAGWQVRRFCLETVPMKIAWWLPKRVAYWAFIRVYATLGEVGPDYSRVCDTWEQRVGDCGWR